MIQYIIALCIKILTTDAIIKPITAIIKIFPQEDKSFFVKYPYKLIAPKVPAVIKKVEAIELRV